MELREKVFNDFISRLPPSEQPQAKRIRESARWSQLADNEYEQGNYRTALLYHLKAYRAAPMLALSPLTGPPLARGTAQSLLCLLFSRNQ